MFIERAYFGDKKLYLWVVRDSEESKLPSWFLESVAKDEDLVLKWSPQFQVVSKLAGTQPCNCRL